MNYYQLSAEIANYTQNTFSTADLNTFIVNAEERIFNTVQFPNIRKNVVSTLTAANQYLMLTKDFISVYSLAVIDSSGNYNYLLNKDVNFIREAFPNPSYQGLPGYYGIYGPQTAQPTALQLLLGPTPDQAYGYEIHYFFYPPSIVPGEITTLNPTFNAGTGLTNGTFYNATMTGGKGSGATATVVVSGGVITSWVIQTPGFAYVVGDTLTYVDPNNQGTAGTITVTAVNNSTGQSWLGDNYDFVLLYGALVEAYTFMKGEDDMLKVYEALFKDGLAQAKRAGDALDRTDAYRVPQYRQKVT